MSGQFLNVEKLQVFEEAKIKRLFVEELEHPSYSSSGESRVVETADPKSTSLVYKPGRMGHDPCKLRAIKQGLGVKVNPYEKVVEIRTNLTNKPGMYYKILDTSSQTFKQIQCGEGMKMVDCGDSIAISAYLEAKSCTSDPTHTKLVDGKGMVKTITAGEGLLLTETEGSVTLTPSEIVAGHGIKVQKIVGGTRISCAKQLKEAEVQGVAGAISLYDKESSTLSRIVFPPEYFTVSIGNGYRSVVPKQLLESPITSPLGISLLQGNTLKCLVGGTGCRLRERNGSVFIDALKTDFADDFALTVSSETLKIEQKNKKISIEVPDISAIENVGCGIKLLDGKKMKTIVGTGCKVSTSQDGNMVEIVCDNVIKNATTTLGSLLTGSKLKAIVVKENLSISQTADTIALSCPMKFPSQGCSVAKSTNSGVTYTGLKGGGACVVRNVAEDLIEIYTDPIRPANSPVGSAVMVNAAREVKAIYPGNGISVLDKGTHIELSAKESIGQWSVIGTPIFDARVKKLRTIRCPDNSIKVTNDQNSVIVKGTYGLKNCTTPYGKPLLSVHDSEKNVDFIKQISVSDDLELEDRGTHIHISSKSLSAKVEALQTLVEELEGKLDKLMLIEKVVANLSV